MEALDNRRRYVGNTLVLSDRHGPWRFMRGGVEVPCVCDPWPPSTPLLDDADHIVCLRHVDRLPLAEWAAYDEINDAEPGQLPRWRPISSAKEDGSNA